MLAASGAHSSGSLHLTPLCSPLPLPRLPPPPQLLVYFAVAKLGDTPTDGKTDVNPEGLTAAYGRHANVRAAPP